MALSIFLAKLLGLYLMIVCAAVFLRRKDLEGALNEFATSKLFAYFSGAVILMLGLAVVLSHNVWELNWRGAITLLGWLTIAKGIIRLFFLEGAKALSQKVILSGWYWIIILVSFLVGVWLAYVGFSV